MWGGGETVRESVSHNDAFFFLKPHFNLLGNTRRLYTNNRRDSVRGAINQTTLESFPIFYSTHPHTPTSNISQKKHPSQIPPHNHLDHFLLPLLPWIFYFLFFHKKKKKTPLKIALQKRFHIYRKTSMKKTPRENESIFLGRGVQDEEKSKMDHGE